MLKTQLRNQENSKDSQNFTNDKQNVDFTISGTTKTGKVLFFFSYGPFTKSFKS